MAILDQGLIGTFRGKMGSIVIAKWKGIYVGKSKPKRSTRPGTETQLQQRAKFALVGKFIKTFPTLIAVGFKDTSGTTSMNEAMKYNLNHAVTGIYPDYKLNYSKINFSNSRGDIDIAIDPDLVPVPANRVKLSWKLEDIQMHDSKDTDILYAVFYSVETGMFFKSELLRSKLTHEVRLSRSFLGEVHGWLFVASANQKFATPTQYLGKVIVAA